MAQELTIRAIIVAWLCEQGLGRIFPMLIASDE